MIRCERPRRVDLGRTRVERGDQWGQPAERLRTLRQARARQDDDSPIGLGLMLADVVARAHGGALTLPEAAQGFVVELALAAAPPSAA